MKTLNTPLRLVILLALLTAAPVRSQTCGGDCDGNGNVVVAEIVLGANILLGNAVLSACTAMDANRDGRILVNDLVTAVNDALCGCMACPTPPPIPTRTATLTPSRTFTPTAELATPTPSPEKGVVLFSEGWQRARVGTYRPRADVPLGGDVIGGDTGDWLVIDTVTNFPECGESPHFAEITDTGGRQLRIRSGNSNSDCADNIDVGAITRNPPGPRGVNADLDDDIFLSFSETGGLNTDKDCDAVSLVVTFDDAYPLAYVLQHGPGWDSGGCRSQLVTPYALVLDPNAPTHTRNLIADAMAVELERPARVTNIVLRVDSDGSATFDDIEVFRAKPTGPTHTPTQTPTNTPTAAPNTCITIKPGTWCLEGEGGAIEGRLSQSRCTITFSDQSLSGPIAGTGWVVDNERFGVHLECEFDDTNPSTECTGFLDTPQGSSDIDLYFGHCDTGE